MIDIKELAIPEVKLLTPKQYPDARGYLIEIVNESRMQELGLPAPFVQENQSFSRLKNTVRGMHAQRPPQAQVKLVRVAQGKIFDVAIDVRSGSSTYGKHASAILSGDDVTQMLIPAGFLHGFCTLEDDTVVLYKMSDFYAPSKEIGVIWNDPDLNIEWPIDPGQAILSERDKKLPRLKDFPRIEW
jgi:dTDP-4-dehydrorhamnose 3,5-epimerase